MITCVCPSTKTSEFHSGGQSVSQFRYLSFLSKPPRLRCPVRLFLLCAHTLLVMFRAAGECAYTILDIAEISISTRPFNMRQYKVVTVIVFIRVNRARLYLYSSFYFKNKMFHDRNWCYQRSVAKTWLIFLFIIAFCAFNITSYPFLSLYFNPKLQFCSLMKCNTVFYHFFAQHIFHIEKMPVVDDSSLFLITWFNFWISAPKKFLLS